MRDDIYPLTGAERRAAVAGWRETPLPVRREICRLADRGLPAPEPADGVAARRYGEFLLQKNVSNRMPRWALPMFGVILVALGLLMVATDPWSSLPGIIAIAGGIVVAAGGALSWAQRRAGHLLVTANPPIARHQPTVP